MLLQRKVCEPFLVPALQVFQGECFAADQINWPQDMYFAGERPWMVHGRFGRCPRALGRPLGRCSTRQPTGVQTISSACISFHEHVVQDQSLVGLLAVFPDASIIVDVSNDGTLHAMFAPVLPMRRMASRDIGLQFHAVGVVTHDAGVRPLLTTSSKTQNIIGVGIAGMAASQ